MGGQLSLHDHVYLTIDISTSQHSNGNKSTSHHQEHCSDQLRVFQINSDGKCTTSKVDYCHNTEMMAAHLGLMPHAVNQPTNK